MDTILLSPDTWDLLVDMSGNIAMAKDVYSNVQDAASEIRFFSGEYWYDTTQGIPYWQQTIGLVPPIQLIKAQIEAAAEKVPGVVSAKCYIASVAGRQIAGQVQIIITQGQTLVVTLGNTLPPPPTTVNFLTDQFGNLLVDQFGNQITDQGS